MYGEGVSKTGEIVDLASENNIIQKSGAWFSYNGEKIGQGRENVKQYLKMNPDILEEIENKVRDIYNIPLNKKGNKTKKEEA